MDDQNTGMNVVDQPFADGEDTAPAAGLISQYVKDLSFENPNAPAIYQSQNTPGIDVQFNIAAAQVDLLAHLGRDVQFNIAAAQVGEEVHEVTLKIEVRAEGEGQVAFIVDLSYAGLFGLRNIPAEHVQPFLLGEAPRLLFPFARRVLADCVRDGGFPPLLLEPIDFAQLYLQQSEGAQPNVAGYGQA